MQDGDAAFKLKEPLSFGQYFKHMSRKKNSTLSGVKEIARRANVAIATVDRVLHNRTGVSENTRSKVNKIIKEVNYQPNLLARRLASRKILRLATIIPKASVETSFWEAPLKGIEQAEAEISQFGISIDKYFYDQNEKDSFIRQTNIILKSSPDGVLLAPSFIQESLNFTKKCKKNNIPYVLIDSDLPNQESLSYIGPDLVQSGYLAGHLISYLLEENGKILLVNISKEIDNHHHLLKKEEGFKAYFRDNGKSNDVIRIDIRQTHTKAIYNTFDAEFKNNKDIKIVFVTNSRVANVAQYLDEQGKNVILIGYDSTKENIDLLSNGKIDFLICQKPMEQAYRGMIALYHHLAFSMSVAKAYFMPIDILTKENIAFYRN